MLSKNVLLNSYYPMKKNQKDSDDFFENQIFALFDTFHLHQFTKFNVFMWLQLFFSQKPFYFCIHPLKTPQPILPYWMYDTMTTLSPSPTRK